MHVSFSKIVNVTLSKSIEILLKACVRFVAGNMPFRGHVTPHRIDLVSLSAKHRREYSIAIQAYKSLATSNPRYIHSRFSRMGEDITLRRSERHPAQILNCNFLRPEKADQPFKRAATDLFNKMVSTFPYSTLVNSAHSKEKFTK